MDKLRITWTKSGIGYPDEQKRTLKALGFRHLHQIVEHDDIPSVRGMLNKVRHLIRYETVHHGTK